MQFFSLVVCPLVLFHHSHALLNFIFVSFDVLLKNLPLLLIHLLFLVFGVIILQVLI